MSDAFYQYQVTPKYILAYNGYKIEAIRAYERKLELTEPRKDYVTLPDDDQPEL